MNKPHWRDRLPTPLPNALATVSIDVDASKDNAAVVTMLARLPALLDALRLVFPAGCDDDDLIEDKDDLLLLLTQLHHVRLVLEGQEERVLQLCRRHNIPLRLLADALDLRSPESVRKRLAVIDRAERHQMSAAAMDEERL